MLPQLPQKLVHGHVGPRIDHAKRGVSGVGVTIVFIRDLKSDWIAHDACQNRTLVCRIADSRVRTPLLMIVSPPPTQADSFLKIGPL